MSWITTLLALVTKYWPLIQAILAAISSIVAPAAAHFQLAAQKAAATAGGFAGPSDQTWWLYVPGQAAAGLTATAFLSALQSFSNEAHRALDRERQAQAKAAEIQDLRNRLDALPANVHAALFPK